MTSDPFLYHISKTPSHPLNQSPGNSNLNPLSALLLIFIVRPSVSRPTQFATTCQSDCFSVLSVIERFSVSYFIIRILRLFDSLNGLYAPISSVSVQSSLRTVIRSPFGRLNLQDDRPVWSVWRGRSLEVQWMSGSRVLRQGAPEGPLEEPQEDLQGDSGEPVTLHWLLNALITGFSYLQLHDDPRLGRHFRATRDIHAGELILREKPLVMGPKINSVPICLGCHQTLYVPIGVRNFYKCSKCHWPLCGKECESAEMHLKECRLMAERKFVAKIDFDSAQPNKRESAYCAIMPLRCILVKDDDPKA